MTHKQLTHLLRAEEIARGRARECGDEDLVCGSEGAGVGDRAHGFGGDGQGVRGLAFVQVGDADVDCFPALG